MGMNNESMAALMRTAFTEPANPQKVVNNIAERNKLKLPAELPENVHVPDAAELENMRQYAIALRKNHPTWSKRKIRKDVQSTFNIKIYK